MMVEKETLKKIHNAERVEDFTGQPIFSKYTINDYDRYYENEGYYYRLSKEEFEYYYNVYEPKKKAMAKEISKVIAEIMKKQPEELTTKNPFCSDFIKEEK